MRIERLIFGALVASAALSACGADDDDTPEPRGGSAGASGRGGSAGKGGSSGKGGSAGKGGSSGKGGSAGRGGSSGTTAGEAGEGGSGAEAGEPGTAGEGGSGGGNTPECTDFTSFVTTLVTDQTRDDNEPVPTTGRDFCTNSEDPNAFDALF